MSSAERLRQLKVMISDEEWEKLDLIAEADDASRSELLRQFIHRRYAEVMRDDEVALRDALVLTAIADDLAAAVRRLRVAARRRAPSNL